MAATAAAAAPRRAPALWWSEQAEALCRSGQSLSTSEQYVRSTLWLNYLLHGERVTSPEQIVSDEFRAYLQPLFPLLFPAPDGQPYVALY